MKGGVLMRIVYPNAALSEIGDCTYKDNDFACYDVTFTCTADAEGCTHYKYIQKKSNEGDA
jgi:hypothetical protein